MVEQTRPESAVPSVIFFDYDVSRCAPRRCIGNEADKELITARLLFVLRVASSLCTALEWIRKRWKRLMSAKEIPHITQHRTSWRWKGKSVSFLFFARLVRCSGTMDVTMTIDARA